MQLQESAQGCLGLPVVSRLGLVPEQGLVDDKQHCASNSATRILEGTILLLAIGPQCGKSELGGTCRLASQVYFCGEPALILSCISSLVKLRRLRLPAYRMWAVLDLQ